MLALLSRWAGPRRIAHIRSEGSQVNAPITRKLPGRALPLSIGVLLMASLIAACGSVDANSEGNSSHTVKMVRITPSIADWCFMAASKGGFFGKHGIELSEPLFVQTSADLNRAMLAGEGQLALGAVDLTHAGFGDDPPFRFIGSTGLAVHTFAGPDASAGVGSLSGKTIALGPQDAPSTLIAESVFKEQIGAGKYDVLNLGGGSSARVAALDNREAQAAVLQPPYGEVALEADSSLDYIDSVASYGEFAQGIIIADSKWLDDNPGIAGEWMAAYVEGCDWLYDPANEAEAVDLLASETKISESAAEKTYARFIDGEYRGIAVTPDAHLEPKWLENYLELVVAAGILPKDSEVSELAESVLDDSAVQYARKLRSNP